MPLYVVDTIVQFRHKYVIEAKELEHAFDEVVMRDSNADEDFFEEVTQRYLGETITDGREITMDEFKSMMQKFAKDRHETSSHWMDERLIRKINYEEDEKTSS